VVIRRQLTAVVGFDPVAGERKRLAEIGREPQPGGLKFPSFDPQPFIAQIQVVEAGRKLEERRVSIRPHLRHDLADSFPDILRLVPARENDALELPSEIGV
jgi:hypothetical protein